MLPEILARKRRDVAARRRARPLADFRDALQPSKRSLAGVLKAPHTGFILECKKASPSAGLLRPDFDVAALARDYVGVADAISVITDEPFFSGELSALTRVQAAVELPVLCKDFVVDPYQIYEARDFGADAVLLILAALADETFTVCFAAAESLGLDVLAEVHNEKELTRAVDLGARIIGINNRDLATLEVDTHRTHELAPRLPNHVIKVCESGIFHHHQIRDLRGVVDAFLIGTSLMKKKDVASASRELAYGRVKVCGLTRASDARAAWRAGATFGGLVFAEGSPRQVTPETAALVAAAAPLKWVGVFVDQAPSLVAAVAKELSLSAVQLHGGESKAYIDELRPRLPSGCALWKAQRVGQTIGKLTDTGADRLLVDALVPGMAGGTGQRFDWQLLADHPERDQIILAGGLGPDNAAAADRLGVWALDVSSGVEAAPGHKAENKLAGFFAALRGP